MAVGIIVGHQNAFHYSGDSTRFGGCQDPGKFPPPARTQMPCCRPRQVPEMHLGEFLPLARTHHQQLRRSQSSRLADDREFKGLSRKFTGRLQFLQLLACFLRQSLNGTAGSSSVLKGVHHQSWNIELR